MLLQAWSVVFDENNLGIEKEQEKNFTQDISWSLDVSTKTKSHNEAKKQTRRKRSICKPSVIMRTTLSLMKSHQ